MQGDLFWEEIQKTEHRNAEFSDPELRYAVRNAVEYRNICVQCAVYSVCTLYSVQYMNKNEKLTNNCVLYCMLKNQFRDNLYQ